MKLSLAIKYASLHFFFCDGSTLHKSNCNKMTRNVVPVAIAYEKQKYFEF